MSNSTGKPKDPDAPNPKLIVTIEKGEKPPKTRPAPPPREDKKEGRSQ
jgi:hypothetical protein